MIDLEFGFVWTSILYLPSEHLEPKYFPSLVKNYELKYNAYQVIICTLYPLFFLLGLYFCFKFLENYISSFEQKLALYSTK